MIIKVRSILLVILLTLIVSSVGLKIFRKFRVNFSSQAETFIFSLGLGYGILGYFTFFLGHLSLLYSSLAWGSVIFFLFISRREFLFLLREIGRGMKNISLRNLSPFFLTLLILFLIQTLVNLILALTPPIGWDELVYHLTLPKLWLQAHKIYYPTWMFYAKLPFLLGNVYTFALLLEGDILAKLIHYSFGLLSTLAIYSVAKKYFNQRVALLAGGIFYLLPLVNTLSSRAYVDLGAAFFCCLATIAFLSWTRELKLFWVGLSSIFIGLAISVDRASLVALASSGILYFGFSLLVKRNIKLTLRTSLFFSSGAILIFSPWLVKNYFVFKDPFSPFIPHLFSQVESLKIYPLTPAVTLSFLPGLEKVLGTLSSFLNYLWKLGMWPRWTTRLSPLFLAFLPAIFFFKKTPIIKLLLVQSFLFLAILSSLGRYPRYSLIILPGLSILVAYIVCELQKKGGIITKIVNFLVLFNFCFSLSSSIGFFYSFFPAGLGLEKREHFLSRVLPKRDYKIYEYVNKKLLPQDKLIIFNSWRTYYCEVNYEWAESPKLAKLKNTSQFLSFLQQKKFQYLLLDERCFKGYFHIYHYSPSLGKLLKNLVTKHAKLVYKEGEVMLYQVLECSER